MSLAACISRWPATTRWPSLADCAAPGVLAEHRRPRLLDLQEQRVIVVAAEQQDDPAARADAADPDHLAGHVDELEPVEQGRRSVCSVRRYRPTRTLMLVATFFCGPMSGRSSSHRDDQRRAGDEARRAVHGAGQLPHSCWLSRAAPWPAPLASSLRSLWPSAAARTRWRSSSTRRGRTRRPGRSAGELPHGRAVTGHRRDGLARRRLDGEAVAPGRRSPGWPPAA